MSSNPLFIIPDCFLHFPNNLSYGYLRFERKLNLDSQQNFFPYLPKGIFPFPSNLRQLYQSSLGKCKIKSGIMKSGLDDMPLFLLDDLLCFENWFRSNLCNFKNRGCTSNQKTDGIFCFISSKTFLQPNMPLPKKYIRQRQSLGKCSRAQAKIRRRKILVYHANRNKNVVFSSNISN